jgi:hypothetical protein
MKKYSACAPSCACGGVLMQVLERLEDFIMSFALEFDDGDVFFLLFQGGVDDACPT